MAANEWPEQLVTDQTASQSTSELPSTVRSRDAGHRKMDSSRQQVPERGEEMSLTISLKPQLLSQSFTDTFPGQPHILNYSIKFQRDPDDHLLILTLESRRRGIRDGDHQEDIKTFNSEINSNFPNYFQQRENVFITHTQWQDFKKVYNDECKEKKNHQHLFCSIFGEGYKKTFFVPKPDYRKKNSTELTIHTEETLIKQTDEYLEQEFLSKIPKGGNIVIYSSNSPCMKRENNTKDPCMFQLLVKAKQWYIRFKILTTFSFTESWGLIGSNTFKDPGILHQFTKNCKFPIQLTRKQLLKRFKGISENQFLSMVPDKDKKKLSDNIKELKKALMKLAKQKESLSFKEHLDMAKEVIELPRHPTIQSQQAIRKIKEAFLSVWSKMLKSCSEEHNRAEITKNCNSAIVNNFLQNIESILGESSPIQFWQIPPIDGLIN